MSARPGVAQAPHTAKRVASDTGWQSSASCVGRDPELFFDESRFSAALDICRVCPVKDPCRELGRGQRVGVWGGRIHRSRRPRTCPVCRNPVARTRFDRVAGHRDSAGNRCPGAGLAYETAEESA